MSDHDDAPNKNVPEMLNLPPLTFEDLLAIGRTIRVPQPLPARTPAPGEIWRVRWDEASALVVVVRLEKSQAEVVPCTFDVDPISDGLPVVGDHSLFVAWHRSRTIPAITLDVCFGATPLTAAGTETDDSVAIEKRLADELDPFSHHQFSGEGDGSLPALITKRSLPPSALAADLGVPPGVALQIRRGKRAVDPFQARKLARILAVPEREVLRGNPRLPGDLVADLQEHRHRKQLQHLAAARQLTDSEAWSTAAYGVLPTAARHTGGQESGWHLRIDRYFESEGIRND